MPRRTPGKYAATSALGLGKGGRVPGRALRRRAWHDGRRTIRAVLPLRRVDSYLVPYQNMRFDDHHAVQSMPSRVRDVDLKRFARDNQH